MFNWVVSRVDILFFFFNDTATTEIYTLSLHDALPIWSPLVNGIDSPFFYPLVGAGFVATIAAIVWWWGRGEVPKKPRSEEHTSELQSRQYLVCRLLLEKKKKYTYTVTSIAYTTYLDYY